MARVPDYDRRWTLGVPLIVLLAAAAMVLVCRQVNLVGSRQAVGGWMRGSLQRRIPVFNDGLFRGLAAEAHLLAVRAQQHGVQSLHEPGEKGAVPGSFQAILGADGRILDLTEESCFTAVAELQRQLTASRKGVLILCGRQLAAVVAARLPEDEAGRFLVVGRFLGDGYVEDLVGVAAAEVVIRDPGGTIATSFKDLEGKPIRAPLPEALETSLASGDPAVRAETLRLTRYGGFAATDGRLAAGQDAVPFFVVAGPLPDAAPGSGLQLVLAAPTAGVTRGLDLATLLQSACALVLAAGVAASLVLLYKKLSRPLYELRAATARVADGDFTVEVTASGSGETAKVATDFNAMVRRLREASMRLANVDKLASVGTLAAGVAHEINNPLSFVTANLEYVEGELQRLQGLDPDRAAILLEAIGDARQGAERVRAIVRDMRLFGGHREEAPRSIDVRPLIESSINLASSHLLHKARLVRDIAQVPNVLGSQQRLGQVFLNLLMNAAQSISVGSGDTNVIQVRTRLERGHVVVEIIDTGEGIPPENMKRLFDPFFTTKPVGEGTGLGLSICHGIVTALGGTMEVESELGAGSAFRVLLPVAPADDAALAA